jgi:hypothetical protein
MAFGLMNCASSAKWESTPSMSRRFQFSIHLTANWCIVSLVMGESMENLTGSGMDTASANANQGLNDFRKSLSRLAAALVDTPIC